MLLQQAGQKWLRLKDKWQARFPLSPAPHLGSWLDADPQGVGCRACRSAGRACSFGAYIARSAAVAQVVKSKKHAEEEGNDVVLGLAEAIKSFDQTAMKEASSMAFVSR